MADASSPATGPSEAAEPRRVSRRGLYGPILLFLLLILGWSAVWLVVRNRTAEAIDGWFAREAALGRQWTCTDRSVGGYPFRIVASCAGMALVDGAARASVGRVTSVAQVYQPRHIITQIEGPLRYTDDRLTLEGEWRLLEASLRLDEGRLERASLLADAPRIRAAGPGLPEGVVSSGRLEAHLRPNPARWESEGAIDAVVQATAAVIPGLDALIGGTEPANLELQATSTRSRAFTFQAIPEELERWRQDGGRLDIVLLALNKGGRRFEAKGAFGLDALHRPEGEIQGAASGIEGILGPFIGDRAGGAGGILGAFLGRSPAPAQLAQPGARALSPLPPLRIEDGRVFFGPIPLPRVRILPLY